MVGENSARSPTSKLIEYAGGVVQYDFGKTVESGEFKRMGSLNRPPPGLMTGVAKLQARHRREGNAISLYISKMLQSYPKMVKDFQHQGLEHDQLFQAEKTVKTATRDGYYFEKLETQMILSSTMVLSARQTK